MAQRRMIEDTPALAEAKGDHLPHGGTEPAGWRHPKMIVSPAIAPARI